jgi:DivIVA domain-containing protein
MGQLLLYIVVALTVAAIVFGVTVMIGGGDPGLEPVEPDGRALPLPGDRPLGEEDVVHTRFDTALRGYRMSQVDQALQRAAYDIGYKGELIGVLEAEVAALREGRIADADVLRRAREAAVAPPAPEAGTPDAGSSPVPSPAEEPLSGSSASTSAPAGSSGVNPAPAGSSGVNPAPAGSPAVTPAPVSEDPSAIVADLPPGTATSSPRTHGTTPADAPDARPVGDATPVERR